MSENPATRDLKYFGTIGLVYGVVLAIISMSAAGAGHGTYVLMGIFSAPFGFFGIPGALVGTIVLWLMAGWLIKARQKQYLLLLLIIHYGGIFLILNTETFGDFEYFSQIFQHDPSLLILGGIVYVLGQLLLWGYLLFVKPK